jgi:hypothetical protein
MPFVKTTILSTREVAIGSRRLGQVVAVPNGRLDKVSLYLEPEVSSAAVAESAMVIVEAYATDGFGLPSGAPLAQDSKRLADVGLNGFSNFRLEADVPTTAIITLRMDGGDADNLIAWRYTTASSGGELLVSLDAGATWSQDSTRKFAYVTYSAVADVVDTYDQSALVQASEPKSVVDDTEAEFSLATLERAAVEGDTVVVDFGDMIITLVVDQSGSMTWNDRDGVRFDFLKAYIDDLESILPAGASARYSIVKFRSRRIGTMTLLAQSGEDVGAALQGVRIVRNQLGPPLDLFTAGNVTIFEGLAEQFVDRNLDPGTKYYYAAFTFDSNGNFSDQRINSATTESNPAFPDGVAGFSVAEEIVLSGEDDIGIRNARARWAHPAGFSYDKITLIRRSDRFADSPEDLVPTGNSEVLLNEATGLPTQFLDTGLATGQEYFYSIFTHFGDQKCLFPNARKKSIKMSVAPRDWETQEPPNDVPPPLFDDVPPAPPTGILVAESPGELMLEWDLPGDDAVRWKIFHHELRFPRPKTLEAGVQDYDGKLVYEGASRKFIHRSLENGQPNFYVIVAIDATNNHSVGAEAQGRPSATSTDDIAPPPVSSFASEPIDSTTNVVAWKLEGLRPTSIAVFFGDTARFVASVSFADTEGAAVSSTFEIVEVTRSVQMIDGFDEVDPEEVIRLASMSSNSASIISSTATTNPVAGFLNNVKSASITVMARLRVVKKSTGELLHEVRTTPLAVTFQNPLEVSISNDPAQNVSFRGIKPTCTIEEGPSEVVTVLPGVYVGTGASFNAALEVKFRGVAPVDDVVLRVRILDATTGRPSTTVKLPETRNDGVAILTTRVATDEVVDRSGQPTGDAVSRSLIGISLPAQDVPGKYVLEVSASHRGFSRIVTQDVAYQPSLNVDVEASSFVPNGVDIAEQKAFVYFGDPLGPQNEKRPVPDGTVTDWSARLIGGDALGKARPFFSRDGVPGTGVKAATKGGLARNVFFGPGTDVEESERLSCTEGEMWLISAAAKVAGQTASGSAVVELLPTDPLDEYDRILLRVADGGQSVDGPTSGILAATEIFSDGEMEATFEVVAKPEEDGDPDDIRSGRYFRNRILAVQGRVPSLEDGRIINGYLRIKFRGGGLSTSNMLVRTNLTGPGGTTGRARAMVENGRALFHVRCNSRVSGPVPEVPLGDEINNEVYDTDFLVFRPSPTILSLVVFTVVEVGGKPTVFSGGGFNIERCTPTSFISLREPLA